MEQELLRKYFYLHADKVLFACHRSGNVYNGIVCKVLFVPFPNFLRCLVYSAHLVGSVPG